MHVEVKNATLTAGTPPGTLFTLKDELYVVLAEDSPQAEGKATREELRIMRIGATSPTRRIMLPSPEARIVRSVAVEV